MVQGRSLERPASASVPNVAKAAKVMCDTQKT